MQRIAIVVVLMMIAVPAANAEVGRSASAGKLRAQVAKSTSVIRFWEGKGRWLRAPRHEHCREVPWPKSCQVARASYRQHTRLLRVARKQLWFVLPAPNDWVTAVNVAQRVYPGTASWLLSCSSTEGGHGRWVPNSDGAPPGGWMQMYESTFWRMWGAGGYEGATDDMARRGFVWPRSAASWYSPLGQALASAWGVTHGRRGEWNSSGC